jgi:hypothetical protein
MKNLFVFLVFVFLSVLCRAQSTSHAPGMDDVQISISLTNNIIPVGSTFSIFAEMKNVSTNIISMGGSSPEQIFPIFLTSASGTIYQISPTPVRITRSMQWDLNPGEMHEGGLFAAEARGSNQPVYGKGEPFQWEFLAFETIISNP